MDKNLQTTFSFELPAKAARGQEVLVRLQVHTGRESTNAVSGEIRIPTGIEVKQIYTGDSAVILWVDQPTFATSTQSILFSGLTPGGITGDRTILSFVIRGGEAGTYAFTLEKPTTLKNDGNGTPIVTTVIPRRLTIDSRVSTSTVVITDTVSPEPFVPALTFSEDILGKETYISFSAQDKGVGIGHYEYAARFRGQPGKTGWTKAESPFVLPRSAYAQKIYIKAVDKVGNERIEVIHGPSYYKNIGTWSIIILLLITCVLYIRKRLRSS